MNRTWLETIRISGLKCLFFGCSYLLESFLMCNISFLAGAWKGAKGAGVSRNPFHHREHIGSYTPAFNQHILGLLCWVRARGPP